ncbi:hypothetical protein C2G38_2183525 [Gigaspora rosea]|uniref:Uncharacterized protein n=1 Tax=Gigaspora rosea TaxID=44941 RepID=A0A397VC01_9GLOM|nr:hypothetical protein C2G38_2183525 [Gigaspora rosea]
MASIFLYLYLSYRTQLEHKLALLSILFYPLFQSTVTFGADSQPPISNNPINNLAAQIGLLIQQMQAALALQINVPNRELNLVPYPDFAGGDQDPITISNPTLKGKWVEQLATRNQQIEEDEDAYHAAIQELLRRKNVIVCSTPSCITLFIDAPNTLQVAYEQAKVYESACQQNLPYTSTSMSTLYLFQLFHYPALGSPILNSNSNTAIDKLTDTINKMLHQLQERHPAHDNTQNYTTSNSSFNPGPNFTLVVPNVAAVNASNAIPSPNVNSSSTSVTANLSTVNNSNSTKQNYQPTNINIAIIDVPFSATKKLLEQKKVKEKEKEKVNKNLEIKIERPSAVNMVSVHRKSKRVLGEIYNLLFMIGGIKIPGGQEIINPAKFKILTHELLGKNQPTKVCRLDEREEAKIDENLTDSKEEFEEKKLEEKIYNYLGIDNKERNYYYVPEAEELNLKGSLEFDETWEKRPFSNLADYIALLKSQLKSELPITLNTINASFTANKDITFENSKHTDNNSKPILPVLVPTTIKKLDNKNLIDKSLNPIEEKKETPSVIYLYDINGNIYLRENKVRADLRRYISLEITKERNESIMDLFDYYYSKKAKKKNIFNIGSLEKKQYQQLQNLLEQNSILFAWEAEKQIIKDELGQMLKNGIIIPCESLELLPWC